MKVVLSTCADGLGGSVRERRESKTIQNTLLLTTPGRWLWAEKEAHRRGRAQFWRIQVEVTLDTPAKMLNCQWGI